MRTWLAVLILVAGACPAGRTQEVADAPDGAYRLDCEAAERLHRAERGVAFLVVSGGAVVCERYDRGASAQDAWPLASGVKGLTSVMVALAVQDGWIGLDVPVAEYLEAWRGDPDRTGITVRHLLHQSSGLAWSGRRLPDHDDALAARQDYRPGERFAYSPVHFEALGAILQQRLDAAGLEETPAHYLARRGLAPLGARTGRWTALDGQPVLSEGVEMTPRDWARFGLLVSRGGNIGGVQIGDPAVMQALIEPGPVNAAYGLGWWLIAPGEEREGADWPDWLDARPLPEALPPVAMAAGAGGQRLYLVPELDLVVVRMTRGERTGPAVAEADWSDRQFLAALIVPPSER